MVDVKFNRKFNSELPKGGGFIADFNAGPYAKMLLIIVGILNALSVRAQDPEPIVYPGNINVAFLLDLHSSENDRFCAEINPAAVQQLVAGVWSTDVLNSAEKNDSTEFGLTILDTCGSPEVATRQIFRLLERPDNCTDGNKIPLLGVVGVGETDVLTSISSLLSSFSIPFIIASPGGQNKKLNSHNILVTSPDLVSQVKPLASLLQTFSWTSVRLITSSSAALDEFISVITSSKVALTQSLLITENSLSADSLRRLVRNNNNDEEVIVVVLLSPEELFRMTKILSSFPPLNDVLWVIASPSLDRTDLKNKIGPILGSGIFLEMHSPNLSGFRTYFFDSLLHVDKKPLLRKFLSDYAESTYNCSWSPTNSSQSCSELELKTLDSAYHQHPGVGHVADAISALVAGFRILTLDFCGGKGELCSGMKPLAVKMLPALRKLGFSFRKDVQPELEGSQYRFTGKGKLITVHSHVIFYNGSREPSLIGWYSEELGTSINSLPPSFYRSKSSATYGQSSLGQSNDNRSDVTLDSTYPQSSNELTYDIHVERVSHNASVRRPWAAATLALSSVGILGTIYILVYVVLRIYDKTLTGNQFFGVALLFSVAALYVTCIVFVLPPTNFTCALRIIIHPTAHALCYSVILVKILGLRSLVQLGLGGSVNYSTLFFALIALVSFQLAVVIEYLILSEKWTDASSKCQVSNRSFVYLHVPAVCILVLTAVYAFLSRHIRRNYHEIISLLLVSIVCIPIWIGWIVLIYSAPKTIVEPAVCAHLLTVATVVMLGVFVPKLRTLSRRNSAYDHKKLSNKNVGSEGGNKMSVNTIFQPDILAGEVIRHPMYARNLCSVPEK